MKRSGSAIWKGPGPTGTGELTTTSGALQKLPYSAKLRFENEDGRAGTNPEELIAAAHAGCFSMALAFQLTKANLTADELRTTAEIDMVKGETGWSLKSIVLHLEAKIPGIDAAKFDELTNVAKSNCPVSRALASVPIELKAKLV